MIEETGKKTETQTRKTRKNTKCKRHLKVYETSGYRYKPMPTIILKGDWLQDCGFHAGDNIEMECSDGVLVVKKK